MEGVHRFASLRLQLYYILSFVLASSVFVLRISCLSYVPGPFHVSSLVSLRLSVFVLTSFGTRLEHVVG